MLARKTKIGIWVAATLLCVAALGFVLPQFGPGGMFFKRSKVIEKLESPVGVTSWSGDGLLLADGRRIQLPGFSKLPNDSAALSEATRRGVEVAPDGNVVGLLDIHHWCGNDRVGEHVARVNLSHLLLFVGEGTHAVQFSEDAKQLLEARRFKDRAARRWDPGDFRVFEYFSEEMNKAQLAASRASITQPRDTK